LVAKKADATVPDRIGPYAADVTVTDANDHKVNGWARILIGGANTPYSESVPSAPNAAFVLFHHAFNPTFGVQMAIAIQGDHGEGVPSYSFIREYDGDAWRAWKRDYRTIDDLNDYIKTAGRLAEFSSDNEVADANDHRVNGWAYSTGNNPNNPEVAYGFVLHYTARNAAYGIQDAYGIKSGDDTLVSSLHWRREYDNGTWRAWQKVHNTIADLDDAVPIFNNGHLKFSPALFDEVAAASPDTGVYLGRVNVGSHLLFIGATGSHAERSIMLTFTKNYNSATAGSKDENFIIANRWGSSSHQVSFHAVTVDAVSADLFMLYDIPNGAATSNFIRWSVIANGLNRAGFSRPASVTVPTLDASNEIIPKVDVFEDSVTFADAINILGNLVLHEGNIATANNFKNNTAEKLLETGSVWGAVGEITLTDSATISVNIADFINAKVTLGGNRTLGNPFNTKAGHTGYIRIIQDATGSRTLSFGANWKFAGGVAPVLSTAANAVDMLFYTILPDGTAFGSLVKDIQ
jgi:hypothetical protein